MNKKCINTLLMNKKIVPSLGDYMYNISMYILLILSKFYTLWERSGI